MCVLEYVCVYLSMYVSMCVIEYVSVCMFVSMCV